MFKVKQQEGMLKFSSEVVSTQAFGTRSPEPQNEDGLVPPSGGFNLPGPLHTQTPPPGGISDCSGVSALQTGQARWVCPTHCTLPRVGRSLTRLGPEQRRHPRGAALNARVGHLPSASLPRAAHDTSAQTPRGVSPEAPARTAGGRRASAGRRHNESAWSENTQDSGNAGRVPAERRGSGRGRTTLATTTGSFVVERLGADRGPGGGRAEEAEERPRRDPRGGAGRGPVRARRRRRRRARRYLGQRSPCSGGGRACGVAGAAVAERAALGVARRAHASQRNRLSRRDIT